MNEPLMGRRSSPKGIDMQIALLLCLLAVVLAGTPLLAYWEYKLVKGRIGTEGWPSVSGDVISAEVRSPGEGLPHDYAAHIVYRYRALGAEHEAETLVPVLSRTDAERIAEKAWSDGLTVYYNLKAPGVSALREGHSWISWNGLIFFVTILGVPLILFGIVDETRRLLKERSVRPRRWSLTWPFA